MSLNDLSNKERPDCISLLRDKNSLLEQENNYLKEQLDWLKRQLFGKRSEKLTNTLSSEELEFDGFDKLFSEEKEKTRAIRSHERRKPNRNGQDKIKLPDDLPVKTTVIDIPEEEKICPETGKPLIQIGVEKSYKLAHKPGSYYLKEIIRPKYGYPTKEKSGIKIAELPDSIIPRCRADESLLAEVVVQKFADHLPHYRISQSIKRDRIYISRKVLSHWTVEVGLALEPIYREMLKMILSTKQLFADETPVRLQEKAKCKQACLWTLVGGKESASPPYKIYDFRMSREHKHGLELLKDYQGVLHSDKYGVYEKIAKKENIKWIPCFAHIRRKFFEVPGDPPFKRYVLRKIKYLFLFERIGWKRSAEERLRIRREKEEPILDELIATIKEKLFDRKTLPKSKMGEAVKYFCGLIGHLKNYINEPYAMLSNNVAERAIRPVAIGRKNWLFFGSERGGKAGGILLSIVQTCRGLGINPRDYLEDVLRRIMSHPANKISELLPDQWLLNQKQRE